MTDTTRPDGVEPIFLVATGETHEARKTYTRHEGAPPPLCDFETLYTAQRPSLRRAGRWWMHKKPQHSSCATCARWGRQTLASEARSASM